MATGRGYDLVDWPAASTQFVPYVGESYWDGYMQGRRLLVVGESHYDDTDYLVHSAPGSQEYRDFTRGVVQDCVFEAATKSKLPHFWRSLTQMLIRIEALHATATVDAWNRIAYMNYIQCIVGKKGQSPKTSQMWKTGEPALKDALRILRPNRVLVLGSTNWGRMQLGKAVAREITADQKYAPKRSVWWFPWDDTASTEGAYATWVYHPSARPPYRDQPPVMWSVLSQLLA